MFAGLRLSRGVSGEGRAGGEPVIVVKIDVHVITFGFGHQCCQTKKKASSVVKQAILGVFWGF